MVKKKSQKAYEAIVRCSNCGELEVVEVRRGVSVGDYLEGLTCLGCGCEWVDVGWELVCGVIR